MVKTPDNPFGQDRAVFDRILAGVETDRAAFLADLFKTYYGVDALHHPVSQAMIDWTLRWALEGSSRATTECAKAWSFTDVRADLPALHVPTLFIHGSGDVNTPLSATVERSMPLVPGETTLKVYEGQPHGLNINVSARLNADLLAFAGVDPAALA